MPTTDQATFTVVTPKIVSIFPKQGFLSSASQAEPRLDDVVHAEPANRVALYNLALLRRGRSDRVVHATARRASGLHGRTPATGFFFPIFQRCPRGHRRPAVGGGTKPDNAKARLHLGALLVAMGAVEAGEALLWG
jgi:hypothetical protein